MGRIKIFDTTLRDGEQSPGCSMNLKEKLEVAKSLEALKVDVIEAGFARSSEGDFEAVRAIASKVKDATVASLARCDYIDIDRAYEAVKCAIDPRLHIFIATSPIHMEYKLKMTKEEVLDRIKEMVTYAKKYCSNIEFSAEDATRSDKEFLVEAISLAIDCGATVINIPDTVGYTVPSEMESLIRYLIEHVDNSDKVEYSVHCHNDLGMAVANALAGVSGGARQIECTIDGLGERAGNTALEEVVMALHTRSHLYPELPRVDTTQIYRASNKVYSIIGQRAPLNKPIVGQNAFAHESGIHQHGILKNKLTYEILTPESVGIHHNELILGKHSGKHAFESHLAEMGYHLSEQDLAICFEEFKLLCDKKKQVGDADIEAIIAHKAATQSEDIGGYKLDWFAVQTSNFTTSTSTICLKLDDKKYEEVSLGDGPIDASFKAIDKIIKADHTFESYNINSVSKGKDTLGDVTIKISSGDKIYRGRGLSTDIIEASIKAYIKALNVMIADKEKEASLKATD